MAYSIKGCKNIIRKILVILIGFPSLALGFIPALIAMCFFVLLMSIFVFIYSISTSETYKFAKNSIWVFFGMHYEVGKNFVKILKSQDYANNF